jgi:hypothetical protein
MRPLIRILIRNGITHNEFSETLKLVFVDVADVDFRLPDRDPSQSRVAILTGLTRKEVAYQKAILEGRSALINPSNLNRVTKVLLGWHTDADFTGPYGMPLELPFDSVDDISIVELLRRYSGDTAPQAMLDELLRVGVVEGTPNGLYKVLTRAYVPESLHPDALERLGTVVRNFVNTVEYNMEKEAPGAGRFERVVVSDNGLREDLMPAFDQLLRIKGQQLLVELDNWLSSQDCDESSTSTNVKTGVGIYHFIEED